MRRLLVASLLLCACLIGAGTLLVQQTKVPPQDARAPFVHKRVDDVHVTFRH